MTDPKYHVICKTCNFSSYTTSDDPEFELGQFIRNHEYDYLKQKHEILVYEKK